jgi:hypothetical protein
VGISQLNGPLLQRQWSEVVAALNAQLRKPSPAASAPPVTAGPAPSQTQTPPVSPVTPPAPAEEKPSALGPPAIPKNGRAPEERPNNNPSSKVRAEEPAADAAKRVVRGATARAVPTPQNVMVVSSPAGATATLDGQPDITCTTPCNLPAQPGRHSIAITMPGYEVEHREVDVGSNAIEVPVVLRAPGGNLYLNSVPAGASISINGKKYSQITPARIALTPGTYSITVEKDGKQNTQQVAVQNGNLKYVTIPLE